MLLPVVLNIIAFVTLVLALGAFTAMKLKHSQKRQVVAFSLMTATLFTLAAAIFNGAAYVQDKKGINLGMPAQVPTKAKLWIEKHKADSPDPKQVAKNIRIIQDGLAFYRENSARFPPEAKTQFEEFAKLPPKIDHILSFAEEQRYYRAAQGTIELISAIAAKAAN